MGQQYLYGATFFRYLSNQYGEDKFAELFNEYGSYFWTPFIGNLLPTIGLDRAAMNVYGKDFESLYEEWKEYERDRNKDWRIDGERVLLTDKGYISNMTYYNGMIYYFKSKSFTSYPLNYHRKNQLVEYNPLTGRERILIETLGSNFGTIEIKEDSIYYLLGEIEEGYRNVFLSGRGIVGNLYTYNLKTGENNLIFSDEIKRFLLS